MKTAVDLTRLASQRTWDKDVVVWLGSEAALTAALPKNHGLKYEVIDLLDLLSENAIPDTDEDVATGLRRALKEKLPGISKAAGGRCVLAVKSAGILVRYNLGLREFFDWFDMDRGLVVLLAETRTDNIQLPNNLEWRPRWFIDYFHRPDLAKH